jgi:NCS1 family nucleobase:cation symporter-1
VTTEAIAPGPLANADLLPTPVARRTWNTWHIASLWVGMSVCIPTYMLAASMIGAGMSWRQSLIAILLGNVIVLVPMVINAHAGTRYGIPFPVYARAAFGTTGAHIPSLLRSVVACGWFGIQTWVGGLAIHALVGILWPAWPALGGDWRFMGYGLPHFAAFLAFWLINMYFVWAGTDSIKWLETVSAPLLIAMGLALLAWAAARAGGLGTVLAQADALQRPGAATGGRFVLTVFVPWVTAMVGFWATLSLNIPDFSRFAKSQKSQIVGQALGLPLTMFLFARSQRDQMAGQALGLLTTMPLFAFIGVAVTSATVILYGEAIWNPVDLLSRLTAESGSPLLGVVALVAVLVATLTTNIAANVVAPANSFSALRPQRVSFRLGDRDRPLEAPRPLPDLAHRLLGPAGRRGRRHRLRLPGDPPGPSRRARPVRRGRPLCVHRRRERPGRARARGRHRDRPRGPRPPGAALPVRRRLVLGGAGRGRAVWAPDEIGTGASLRYAIAFLIADCESRIADSHSELPACCRVTRGSWVQSAIRNPQSAIAGVFHAHL